MPQSRRNIYELDTFLLLHNCTPWFSMCKNLIQIHLLMLYETTRLSSIICCLRITTNGNYPAETNPSCKRLTSFTTTHSGPLCVRV